MGIKRKGKVGKSGDQNEGKSGEKWGKVGKMKLKFTHEDISEGTFDSASILRNTHY